MLNDVEKLERVLLDMGHDDRVTGTNYLRMAVELYYPGCKMEWLYAAVAKAVGKTATGVERAMRYGLEKAWNRCDFATVMEYFGSSWDADRGRPTVGEYLARLDRVTRA